METVYRDYGDKVQFFYVYKTVEHPELNNYVTAFNLKERLKHIAVAKDRFQTEMPWICDSMSDDVKQAFGNAPNGEFILDPNGTLIVKRFWSSPKTLREDLAMLVGASEKVTKVEDLPTAFVPNVRKVASGVVPRIDLPRGLGAMELEPVADEKHPFFAKLRAEMVFGKQPGSGKIYFGIYLDPIYEVHWNNLAGKVKIEVDSNGAELEQTEFVGPDVKEEADVDPRQFLVGVAGLKESTEFDVKLTYTVCDDAETFCTEVTQHYRVKAKFDRNKGTRPGIFLNSMFVDLDKFDKNGDGNLTVDELPKGKSSMYIGHMDYNGNGIIDAKELERFQSMFSNGGGITEPNDGVKQ